MKNNGKDFIWEALTSEERETLAALTAAGTVVFAAPIEIENEGQLEALGITKAQCCTWYVGEIGITVHLTPADQETYEYLLKSLGDQRKQNSYWLGRINTWRKYGMDFDTDYEKVLNAQTTESISAFVAQLLKAGNAAEVIMMPAE